jgi:hypothetical protein
VIEGSYDQMSINGVKTSKRYTKQSKQEAIITGNKAPNLNVPILIEGEEGEEMETGRVMTVRWFY